eukprot:3696045-Rhodomonas_salina.1
MAGGRGSGSGSRVERFWLRTDGRFEDAAGCEKARGVHQGNGQHAALRPRARPRGRVAGTLLLPACFAALHSPRANAPLRECVQAAAESSARWTKGTQRGVWDGVPVMIKPEEAVKGLRFTGGRQVRSATPLRAPYTMPGTELRCISVRARADLRRMSLRARCAMSGTGIGRISLHARYAMCGTDLGRIRRGAIRVT